MLELTEVKAGYTSQEVLHGLSFAVAPGQIVAVVGVNGAGKSTTLKVISGLLAARAGSLRAAATVGLLFALDPFCIRQNDRVLLETSLMLFLSVSAKLAPPVPPVPPTLDAPPATPPAPLTLPKDELLMPSII